MAGSLIQEITMPSARKNYSRFVKKYYAKGSYPLWPISQPAVSLGTIGYITDGVFQMNGHLSNFDIAMDIQEDTAPASQALISTSEVNVTVKASGETNVDLPSIPQAKAGLGFEFAKKGAFIFAAETVYEPRINNLQEIGEKIKALRAAGKWDSSWRVVTSLVRTPVCRMFIARSSNAKIELSLEGNAFPSVSELGKAGITVQVETSSNNIFVLNPAIEVTPFLQVHKLRRKFLGLGGGFHAETLSNMNPEFEFELDTDLELNLEEAEALDLL